jgi:hypothetical protein
MTANSTTYLLLDRMAACRCPLRLYASWAQTLCRPAVAVLIRFAVVAHVLCRTLAHGRKLSKGKIISINVREIWCAAKQLAAVHACTEGQLSPHAACTPYEQRGTLLPGPAQHSTAQQSTACNQCASVQSARWVPRSSTRCYSCCRKLCAVCCSDEIMQPGVPHSLRLQGILVGG